MLKHVAWTYFPNGQVFTILLSSFYYFITALSYSNNIYTVKTHLFLGEETLLDMLKRVGIKDDLKVNPSLALGSSELSLMDITSAYAILANTGYKVDGHLIKKVEDINGNTLYEYKNNKD